MTPRLRADLAGESATLSGSDNVQDDQLVQKAVYRMTYSVMRNSVLSGLSERKLADIQSFIKKTALSPLNELESDA